MYLRRKFIKDTGAAFIGFNMIQSIPLIGRDLVDFFPASLPRTSPEEQGIASSAIRGFVRAANESGLQWHGFMLLRHGNVVAEGWWKPFGPQYKHTLYSLSKSFTSTAIGFLVNEGKLKVDDRVISFFKDELPETVSANLANMRVKHLLTMNTGHAVDTLGIMREAGDSWTRTFLAQPVPHEPGTHFLYNTGATYLLGVILHRVTGQKLDAYLKPRLFEPLDIKGFDWELSPEGLNTAGYGLRIKTEDIARFGQMYLQKGHWNKKQLVPESWIEEATASQTTSNEGDGDWSQGYGYQFWRCKPGFYRGDGAFGQYCVVMPQHDAVIAVNSESSDMQKSMTIMWEHLLPAMQPGTLPENLAESGALKSELKTLSLPTVKGLPSTASSLRYNNKKFAVENNDYGVTQMQFRFSLDGCKWIIRSGKNEIEAICGWSNWQVNDDTKEYPFQPRPRGFVASRIAGTATWLDQKTLQLNLRFVEAIHGDKITCVFEENKVSVRFLNSIAEMTYNNPEKRLPVTGIIA